MYANHHHHWKEATDKRQNLEYRQLEVRQATSGTTTSTNCPDNDGLFYVTAHNYTYQIQCATTYNGQEILTQAALGFTACITQCATYNHDNSTSSSFCVGVNFDAATDASTGDCILFDEVSPVPVPASEEGSVAEAALLIYGPTGQTFATPELQPSQVVGGILTNSLIYTSQPVVPPSSIPIVVSTALVTSVVTVISCAPGITNCPANGLSTSTSMLPAVSPTTASSSLSASVSISNGGMRPLTNIVLTSSNSPIVSSTSLSYSPPYVTFQATETTTMPFTEYRVTTVVSCTAEPATTSCATSATTQVITGLRTEILCSPGPCTGVVIATGTLAGMPGVFTEGCIVG